MGDGIITPPYAGMTQIRFVGSLSAATNRGTPGDEKRQCSAKPSVAAGKTGGGKTGKKMA